jgi:predicted RNase H-related nuclease YkuK (DUF458 family)
MKNKGFVGVVIVVVITLGLVGVGGYTYLTRNDVKEIISTENKIEGQTEEENATATIIEDQSSETSNLVVKTKVATDIETKETTEVAVKTETLVNVTTSSNSSNDPWVIIEKYKGYIKTKDMVGMNSLMYKKFEPCSTRVECDVAFSLIGLYDIEGLNKSNFINRWEDDKQIILATEIKTDASSGEKYHSINRVFFVKDTDQSLKILILGGEGDNMLSGLVDTDKDGLTDQEEKCEGASKYRGDCKITDPSKRDTDGDGWWDGVEDKFE